MKGQPEFSEHGLIRWAILVVCFSLIIGGKPWRFPDGGRPLLRSILR